MDRLSLVAVGYVSFFFFFFPCASVFVFEAVGCHLKSTGAVQWL